MRDSLARIELAASQWLRAHSPGAHGEFAATIRDAVADLDGRITEALALVRPHGPGSAPNDAPEALGSLLGKLRPVLAAREIRLEPLAEGEIASRVHPRLLRRGAIQLLREAAHWAGRGGAIRVGPSDASGRAGICLRAERPARRDGGPSPSSQPLRETERFARASGGQLEWHLEDDALEANLWLETTRS